MDGTDKLHNILETENRNYDVLVLQGDEDTGGFL